MPSKPKGMFSRLVAGDLPMDGKRWPGEGDNGRVFVLPSCSGQLSTTSIPLTRTGPIPADHIEPGKSKKHAQQQADNLARAHKILQRMIRN